VQELYDITRSKDHRPFFLQVSYTHPHEPYLCQPEFWDLYADVAIPLPAVPALKESEHDAHSVRLLQDFGMLNVEFEEADIRRARRAYYGSISYLDHMIARVLATLKATGLDKHTAIIFTSDHGEMLGERGMWFKKHFFEPALRIPLLLSAPWLQPQRVSELVSLVDLLPTFCGLASGTVWSSDVEILDGMDLGQFLTGSPHGLPPTTWTRPVYVEYLAEATTAPVFMIRRGQYKYIQASTDPALLFDVVNDPLERHNLAGKAEYADRVAQFSQEVAGKWDEVALSRDIRLSQQRRRLIRETSRNGTPIRWNHGEESGQDVRWYRGQGSYNDWAFDYLPVLSDR
jgi:choline-sulfatase